MHLLLVKTCGNDEEKQSRKMVILGLDPETQGVFNVNTKYTKSCMTYWGVNRKDGIPLSSD